jgi:hypothetical protein
MIVKFLNGDLKEYPYENNEQLIDLIANDLAINHSLVQLIENDIKEEDESDEEEDEKKEEDIKKINYFVVIQESKDYPFTRWDTYFPALAESLSDNVDHRVRPKYSDLLDENGFTLDCQIMHELLDMDNDPQEGLKGLVQACLDGKYACEIIPSPSFETIVKKMIQKGASINEDIMRMIATPNYFQSKYFEADMGNITQKGFLLKLFLKFDAEPILLTIIPTWDHVEGEYWEDMTVDDPANRYGLILNAQYQYTDAFNKALKSAVMSCYRVMNEAEWR